MPVARVRTSTNTNSRGSSKDRKARKLWLLREFGNGTSAPCSFEGCEETVTYDTITVDRYPVPGMLGGKYTRGNIRPSCAHCNYSEGGRMGAAKKAATSRLDFDTQSMVS